MALRSQRLQLVLPSMPIMMQADAERLAQVFSNLLGNASKYTPDGGEMSVSALLAASGEFVAMAVADKGTGIAAEALPTVFKPFTQDSRALGFQGFSGAGVGMSLRMGVGLGLGLGLTLMQEFLHAHGDSEMANSAGLDEGSEIRVILPLRP